MITITTNLGAVTDRIVKKYESLTKPNGVLNDKLLRTIASSVAGVMSVRIHTDGLKADGTPIGVYSNKYLALRQKEKYKRTSSPKVILSLTQAMEKDFGINATDPYKTSTGWGIGFKFTESAEKAEWNTERYGKIYSLTKNEKDQIRQITEDFISRLDEQ